MKIRKGRSFSSGLLPLYILAHFGHHLLTALPVPLLPMIRNDFNLDYAKSGMVISAFNLSYGIAQLPAGWLTDRLGARITITIGIGGVALAGLLVGLSQTYVMMVVFLVLMGVAGGGYHPAAPPLISASVEPKHRGRALGLHMIGGSSSYFLAPLIAAAIASTWGWRGSFIGLSIPTTIFGVLIFLVLGRALVKRKEEHEIFQSDYASTTRPKRLRRLVWFIILNTGTGAVILSTIAFVPLFMVDHFGMTEESAAAFLALYYSAGLWAGPLGGYLSDRLGRMPVMLTVCFIAGPVIYILSLMSHIWGVGTLLVLLGMVMYIRMPVAESYIIGQTSEHNRSTILGIYYFGVIESGGVLTPLVGYLIDRFSFYHSFTIMGATTLAVTLVCAIFLWGSRD